MKKLLVKIFLAFVIFLPAINTACAETFEYVGGAFDWLYISNDERIQRVNQIFDVMFPKGYVTNFPKGYLKEQLKPYLKDKDYELHYEALSAGYTHYKDVELQPFYSGHTKLIYMYALQYINMPQRTFYYDAMGRLKFVDFRYGDYPNCPYYTKKYSLNGKLVRAMYLQTPDTMYIYSDKGVFMGVKYKNNIYDLGRPVKQ